MKFLIKENLTVLRSKLLERLLSGDNQAMTDWLKKHEQELEIDIPIKTAFPYYPLSMIMKNYWNRVFDDTLKFAVDNLITETIGASGKGFCLFHKEDTFFIFYPKADIYRKRKSSMIRDINVNLRRYLRLSITADHGRNVHFQMVCWRIE